MSQETEALMQREVDALRESAKDTRELYKEVCTLLFFKHGVTPTANMLYRLVRRGSMQTPCAVLNEFWANLREKSRVRVDAPDLPEAIRDNAVAMLGSLWSAALQEARSGFAALSEEVEAQREKARLEVEAAQAERADLTLKLSHAQTLAMGLEAELQRERERHQALEQLIHKLETELGESREALTQEVLSSRAALAAAQDRFAADLQALRSQAELAEDRMQASEHRYLTEIDRARTEIARLEKDLAGEKTDRQNLSLSHQQDAERWMRELLLAQTDLSNERSAMTILRDRYQAKESEMAALESQSATLARDLAETRRMLEQLRRSQPRLRKNRMLS